MLFQECLFHALQLKKYNTVAALVFVMDRFSYWQGSSGTSLRIVKYLETYSPETAIAPQLVMRKARVMKNRGDLQGMGRLLSVSLNAHPSSKYTTPPVQRAIFLRSYCTRYGEITQCFLECTPFHLSAPRLQPREQFSLEVTMHWNSHWKKRMITQYCNS